MEKNVFTYSKSRTSLCKMLLKYAHSFLQRFRIPFAGLLPNSVKDKAVLRFGSGASFLKMSPLPTDFLSSKSMDSKSL